MSEPKGPYPDLVPFALRASFAVGVGAAIVLLAAGVFESIRTEGRLPGMSTAYMRHIDALIDAGDQEQAMEQLQLARSLDIINEHLALNNLANVLQAQGKTSEAMTHYREAISIQPDYAMAHYNLAKALAAQGKADEAIELYRTVVDLAPDHVDARNNLANALALQGHLEEAIPHYEHALRLQPDNVAAHNNLANILATEGSVDEAIEYYQRALRLQPDDIATHHNLAWVLQRAGRLDEALSHFEQAIRLQPEFGSSLVGLSWILATHPEAERRDPERARELAVRALELPRRPDPKSLDIAAAAHAAAGDFERAVALARAALNLAPPDFPELEAMRGRLELYRQGRAYREPR